MRYTPQELTTDEEERLRKLREFYRHDYGSHYTYHAKLSRYEIEKAAELAEKIFVDVFKLPQDYEVKVELNLENMK